jgi:tetratricopeptide (TPR) repeat protein
LRRWLWPCLAVVLATVVAYAPAFRAPFLLDDNSAIAENASIRSFGSALNPPPNISVSGRPVVNATLALDYALNDALGVDQHHNPDGPSQTIVYHVLNLLVHLCTGLLLFVFLSGALGEERVPDRWRNSAGVIAGWIAAIWLLHPIQSEAINYITQRTESLAALCYLATLVAAQRASRHSGTSALVWSLIATVGVLLGILSKETAITAPLAVMLYDRAFRLDSWRALTKRAPLYLALWIVCLGGYVAFAAGARGESAGLTTSVHWYEYLYTQCWAIAHYLRLVVWPAPLAVDYGYQLVTGMRGVPGLVLLAAAGITCLWSWTRVARYGPLAFALSMFFLLLAPSSSVVPIITEVAAERRIYLALAAVLMIGALGLDSLRGRIRVLDDRSRVAIALTVVCVALAATTTARSFTYASADSLWRQTVRAVPENPRAHVQLGMTLFHAEPPQLADAEAEFKQALSMDSSCHTGCLEYGDLLLVEGKAQDAIPFLQRHLAWEPGSVFAARLLALAYWKNNDPASAIPYLEHVVQESPTFSHFVVLGVAYTWAGQSQRAIDTFRAMAQFDSGDGKLRQLAQRLEDGATRNDALENMKEFALQMAQAWL